jgi:hypothetical protein
MSLKLQNAAPCSLFATPGYSLRLIAAKTTSGPGFTPDTIERYRVVSGCLSVSN